MKQVAIFYRDRENEPAIRYIENNLLNVARRLYPDYKLYLDEMPPHQLISADAYLVCYEEMLRFLPNHIDDFKGHRNHKKYPEKVFKASCEYSQRLQCSTCVNDCQRKHTANDLYDL